MELSDILAIVSRPTTLSAEIDTYHYVKGKWCVYSTVLVPIVDLKPLCTIFVQINCTFQINLMAQCFVCRKMRESRRK